MASIEERIHEAIDLCRVKSKNTSNVYVPSIIRSLEKMATSLNDETVTHEARGRMSAALGKLVLENHSFAESELGIFLVKIADDFEMYKPIKNGN